MHKLDVECFAYLNSLLESSMAQTVIPATNSGNALVRGATDAVFHAGYPSIHSIGMRGSFLPVM